MNDGLHFIDIIFFAMVAAFLVLRLRSVLGKRTGNERPPQEWGAAPAPKPATQPTDNVIDLAAARKPAAEPLPEGPLGEGVSAIRAVDPSFSVDGFLSGARGAFVMIVEAYAHGDKATLKPLLAQSVYQGFADAIDARIRAGEVLHTEVVVVRDATMVEARLAGSVANVTVRFKSEQINLVKDLEGRILEGDPNQVANVTDEWSFARDTQSRDPNWQLVATRSPDES